MDKLINLLRSRSARVSAIFYAGNFAYSFANYIFHLVLIRLLTPDAYGEFLTYISFLYLITIPAGTIATLVTKYISELFGKKDFRSINQFFYFSVKKIILPFVALAGIIILLSQPLANLLKAEPLAFTVLGISIITSLFGAILRSYVSSFQRFIFLTIINLAEIAIRILIAYFLVTTGLEATGAVIAMLLSGILSLLVIIYTVRKSIYPPEAGRPNMGLSIRGDLFYSFIYSTGTLSLISVDVLMVRYFFSTADSGLYSGLSLLGRMIYFGMTPLVGLLLPLASARFSSGQSSKQVLKWLSLVTVLLGLIGVGLFSTLPELVISIFSGSKYLAITPLLPLFSLAMFLFALNLFLLTYFIAVKQDRANLILLTVTLLQPLLITIYHRSLYGVVVINLCVQTFMLISLLVYYRMATRHIA